MSEGAGTLTGMHTTYRLPKRFVLDHWDRDLGDPELLIGETRTHLIVALTDEGYAELLDDAEYYIECGPEMGPEYFGLISSARATAKTLKAAQGSDQKAAI